MSPTYDDVVTSRRARLDQATTEQGEVLAQAHKIALQVVDLREKHDLTQTELAERCEMSQADISRIERGATSPTARTLQRIANALDADVRLVDRVP